MTQHSCEYPPQPTPPRAAIKGTLRSALPRSRTKRMSASGAGDAPRMTARVLVPIRHEESRLTMPVYVYRRQDGSTFELEQRISEDSLVRCPTTGQRVERVLQPFTPRYKGTGFYSTDHRRPKAKEQPKGGDGK